MGLILADGVVKPIFSLAILCHLGPVSVAAITIDITNIIFRFEYKDPLYTER